jgi:hypothetical protein
MVSALITATPNFFVSLQMSRRGDLNRRLIFQASQDGYGTT